MQKYVKYLQTPFISVVWRLQWTLLFLHIHLLILLKFNKKMTRNLKRKRDYQSRSKKICVEDYWHKHSSKIKRKKMTIQMMMKLFLNREVTNPALQGSSNSSLLLAPCDQPEAMALWDTRSPTYAMKLEHGVDAHLKLGMAMSAKLWVPEAGVRSAWAPPIALIGHESGHFYIWDLRRMRADMLFCKKLFQAPVMAFDLSRDARRLFAAAVEPSARVYNLDLHIRKITPCSPPLPATCQTVVHDRTGIGHLALRPDAKLFATAGWDFRIRLFANKSPHFKPLAILRYHDATVNALDFSPDSKLLAAASKDTKISVWSGLFKSR
mmetsp:Transcript_12582/g.15223  ORF Transcript_12582/g.15223 Transcript_12582/m.15223 type:complete len:323 (+) Transcript_12582:192-1160(+)